MILAAYKPKWGELVAQWVTTAVDARWLAPGTPPPLTGEKVNAWKKAGGSNYVGFQRNVFHPVAYGELNPMRLDSGHYWIGHVIVDPRVRGQGIGRAFVRKLLEDAFQHFHARRVSLVVFPENAAAIQCYRYCGFRVVGEERHKFKPDGEAQRLLRLEADPTVLNPLGPLHQTVAIELKSP